MDERTLVCPACHHAEHDPGSCPECPRCELHFDEAADWLRRNGQDKTAMWREMFAAVGEQWVIVLDRLDLAEDATADDVLAALATADKPLTGSAFRRDLDERIDAYLDKVLPTAADKPLTGRDDERAGAHPVARFITDVRTAIQTPVAATPTAPALDVLQDEVRHLIRATDERDWTQRDAHMRHLREWVTASPTTDTPE